jgi:hypothetical protein
MDITGVLVTLYHVSRRGVAVQSKTQQDSNFSPYEWSIIVGSSTSGEGQGGRIGWYASILTPIVVFFGYGLLQGEVMAVGLAFICLLSCVIWAIRLESRGARVYRSIFDKVIALANDPESQPEAVSSLEQHQPSSPLS